MTDSNYKQLQALQEKLEPQGFTVLAFPCNQFGGQEPGDAAKIRSFVDGYGVTFPMFAKIDVNGPNTHPVYKFLKKEKREFMGLTSDIKWNFAKACAASRTATAAQRQKCCVGKEAVRDVETKVW
uniref:Glutathione peroxidase n=1 Tax=Chrysotila carterae TaxID=13221 RepID=A0A6S9YNB4_CHRCT|mmetsp:Transcript_29753/g.57426  ORF Transcript_29753/g.57426 Transcript_29753/m.57426 type:complete len:125 (+) Transcript_29753:194-568(+)